MSAIVNDRDVLLQSALVRNTNPTNGKLLLLAASSPVFHVDNSGNGNPASIAIKATIVNLRTQPTFTVIGAATLTGSGIERTLTYNNMTDNTITIVATIDEDGFKYEARQIITKVFDGVKGADGQNGTNGNSVLIAYTLVDGFSLNPTPSNLIVDGYNFPPNGSWGETRGWSSTPAVPAVNQAVFQSNGIYNPNTNKFIWSAPYLSTLKVGALSAINANIGVITSGKIQSATSGERFELVADGATKGLFVYSNTDQPLVQIGIWS